MSGLCAVAATVCGCCIIVSLLAPFLSDGGTHKLLSLVMGAFLLCCLLVPAGKALGGLTAEVPAAATAAPATADEALRREVLAQTKTNVETAVGDVLSQHGVAVKRTAVALAIKDENRVVIASLTLWLDRSYANRQAAIEALAQQHCAVTPRIIWE